MFNLPPIAILETNSAVNVSWEWLKFLERPVSILKKDSTVDVYLKVTKTFQCSYFFETLIDGGSFRLLMNEYEIAEK